MWIILALIRIRLLIFLNWGHYKLCIYASRLVVFSNIMMTFEKQHDFV